MSVVSTLRIAILRKLVLAAWLLLSLSTPLWAAPLETPFFTWEIPLGWTVSRNSSGLWQLTAPGPNPLEAVVSVARLTTTPEAYVQGTAALWKSLGTVQPLQPWITDRPNQAWFLVKHTAQAGQPEMSTVKWVRWRGPILTVTSFKAPSSELHSWAPKIRSMAQDLKLEKPEYEEAVLLEEVRSVLRDYEDTRDTLNNLEVAKLTMNTARQDWEPFFASAKAGEMVEDAQPTLLRAYLAYLESRYDATLAIVSGADLGMGADVVESRLRGVAIKRDELRREAGGF